VGDVAAAERVAHAARAELPGRRVVSRQRAVGGRDRRILLTTPSNAYWTLVSWRCTASDDVASNFPSSLVGGVPESARDAVLAVARREAAVVPRGAGPSNRALNLFQLNSSTPERHCKWGQGPNGSV